MAERANDEVQDEAQDGQCCGSVRRMLREDWALLTLLGLSLVAAIVLYPSLPARFPLHYDIAGNVNRWGSKATGVFGILGLNVGLYLLFLVLPVIDPRGDNYAKFEGTFRFLRTLFVVFMTGIWALSIGAAKGLPIRVPVLVPVATSCLFILFGNLMGKIQPNWFIGFRTPWTLANAEVWRLTHRMGGRAWVLGGLVSLVGAFFGGKVAAVATAIGLGGSSIFIIAYSYYAFVKVTGAPRLR